MVDLALVANITPLCMYRPQGNWVSIDVLCSVGLSVAHCHVLMCVHLFVGVWHPCSKWQCPGVGKGLPAYGLVCGSVTCLLISMLSGTGCTCVHAITQLCMDSALSSDPILASACARQGLPSWGGRPAACCCAS